MSSSFHREADYYVSSVLDLATSIIDKMPAPGKKVRIGPNEQAPEGVQVFVGPRGGKYFYYQPDNELHNKFFIDRQAG